MSTELEDRLRDDLRVAAIAAEPSGDFASQVLADVPRRTRSRGIAVGAVAALASLASVATAVWVAGLSWPTDSSTRTQVASAPPSAVSPRQSLVALPAGAPPGRPISINGMVHDGDQVVPIPGRDGGVVDRVDGGWLVLSEHWSFGAFSSQFGVLTADGSFRALPAFPGRFTQEAAVSPDGSQVFSDSAVLDVGDGTVVDRPALVAASAIGWNQAGIIYLDAIGRTTLWSPGSDPAQLKVDVMTVAEDSDRVLVRGPGRGCASVVQVSAEGATSALFKGCGETVLSDLSPDGDRVLTRDLDVVSIADGAVTALPALAGFQDRVESAGWEDNGHILVAVRASGDHVQPVRCDVVAATCERAGEPLSTVNDYIDFSSYAGEK